MNWRCRLQRGRKAIEQPVEGRGQVAELVVGRWRRQPLLRVALVDASGLVGHPCQRPQRLASDQPAAGGGHEQRKGDAQRHRARHLAVLRSKGGERRHHDGVVAMAGVLDLPAQDTQLAGGAVDRGARHVAANRRQRLAVHGQAPDFQVGPVRSRVSINVRSGTTTSALASSAAASRRQALAELRAHDAFERRHRAREIVVQALEGDGELRERRHDRTGHQHGDDDAAVPERQARANGQRHESGPGARRRRACIPRHAAWR